MTKFAKSSHSRYLNKLKTIYPGNSSVRSPTFSERITHPEFRMVLPMYPKTNVSMNGSDAKPSKFLSTLTICPLRICLKVKAKIS